MTAAGWNRMTGLQSLASKEAPLDSITEELSSLILSVDLSGREDLKEAGKRAFIDYLAAALAAREKPAVRRTAEFVGRRGGLTPLLGQKETGSPENAAFFNGFESHYLDYDDAQANLMGHFSTVLFSALLALAGHEDPVDDFLAAYVAGAEVEGLLGKLVNPYHKQKGFHPTATIGPIGACAAIARFRQLDLKETAELLSLGATRSGGLGLEAGTDTKPLHSGFAAGSGAFSYFLLKEAGLTSSTSAFNEKEGWAAVVADRKLTPGYFRENWLRPGQLISPGLWMKEHQNCSAAIPGSAAAKALYDEGLRMKDVSCCVFHFPPGKSTSLHHHAPKTGQEARFSMEFAAWEILTKGNIYDEDFLLPEVPEEFTGDLPLFEVREDLSPAGQEVRRIVITVETKNGRHLSKEIPHAPGSPENPFSEKELTGKLEAASNAGYAKKVIRAIQQESLMGPVLEVIHSIS